MENFDRAIEDTITAINTGSLRARDGVVLQKAKGKAHLQNPAWRQQMDTIVDLLRALRSRYAQARKHGGIHINPSPDGTESYCINDISLAEWMDKTRSEIMTMFSSVANEAGVLSPIFPRSH